MRRDWQRNRFAHAREVRISFSRNLSVGQPRHLNDERIDARELLRFAQDKRIQRSRNIVQSNSRFQRRNQLDQRQTTKHQKEREQRYAHLQILKKGTEDISLKKPYDLYFKQQPHLQTGSQSRQTYVKYNNCQQIKSAKTQSHPLLSHDAPILKTNALGNQYYPETFNQRSKQEVKQDIGLWPNNHVNPSRFAYRLGRQGLKNIGNTCYMNSGLQCLNKTAALSMYFAELPNGNMADQKFVKIYYELNKEMSRQDRYLSVVPTEMKRAIQAKNMIFIGNRQQDCCELVNTVINSLHESLNTPKVSRYQINPKIKEDKALCSEYIRRDQSRVSSKMDQIFFGRYRTSYRCCSCGHEKVLFERFATTFLPIPAHSFKKQSSFFSECLQEFTREQILYGQNSWNCSNCNKDASTRRSMRIFKAPKVLIFCFKRFLDGEKVNFDISYPKKICLSELVAEEKHSESTYSLYAVVIHMGNLRGGHYYAYCMDQHKKWWLYDDSYVKETSQERAMDNKAYMIFYQLDE